jgi:hypothetical protein
MSWGRILALILSFVEKAASYFQERQLLEAGRGQAAAEIAQENDQHVEKALDAKRDAVDVLVREPDKLRDDDGFRRPD